MGSTIERRREERIRGAVLPMRARRGAIGFDGEIAGV
jgi:hypothetical protein